MRKTGLMIIAATAAFMMACGGGAENKPANTAPANTTKTAAAPTTDVLLDMEKKAHEAYAKGDGSHFETMLSDKFVMSMGKEHMNKAATVKMISTAKCELKGDVKLSEPQLSKIDNDTYAFTYKNETAGECNEGPGGKMTELKPMRNSTVWVRSGEKWLAAWHGEATIVDPKAAAPATDKKDEAKKEEPKKDEVKAAEPKKDEVKKEEPKPAANSAAETKTEAPKASANTDALVKIHTAGWEAFKAKDAKWFDANIASSFAFVNPLGGYTGSKADTIKIWTETMKCEGITKVAVADGFSTALSPTVELLTLKGTADGTCDGEKNGDLNQAAVYVKEGEAWKLAFMFETPAMPAK